MQTQHCGVIARQKKKFQVKEKFHLPKQSHPQPSSVVNGTQNTSGN